MTVKRVLRDSYGYRRIILAERERRLATPRGGVFVPRSQVMSEDDVDRALVRIAHEIIEHNKGSENLALVGLQTGGVQIALKLRDIISEIGDAEIPVGTLDVAFYRDDIQLRPVLPEAVTTIPFDLTNMAVVLVDDVLFTGRTVRAALQALSDFGRARSIQLAVLVDRGHRELPIRPDYVGKNLPTRLTEQVDANLEGVTIGDVIKGRP